MKNQSLLVLLPLLMFFSSCYKTGDADFPESPVFMGQATALFNGDSITFSAYAVKELDDKIRIEIDGRHPESAGSNNISFSKVPHNIGLVDSLFNYEYPDVETRSYCNLTVASGDAIYAFYNLVEDEPGTYLKLTEIDEENHQIKGVFDVRLSIEPDFANSGLDLFDTIRLKEGQFTAVLRR